MKRALAAAVAAAILAGCASPQPKFYPNAYYKQVGETQAQTDIKDCLNLAHEYLKENPFKPIAKKTAWGAVTGAIIGTVVGAITGDFGRVMASGAAAGAAGGFINGAYDANSPDGVVRGYTDYCLAQRGYQVIGWR